MRIEEHKRESAEGQRLIGRALRLQDSADRAFARYFNGEVRSSSGAASVRAKAEEAWADVRLYVEDGAQIESELSR